MRGPCRTATGASLRGCPPDDHLLLLWRDNRPADRKEALATQGKIDAKLHTQKHLLVGQSSVGTEKQPVAHRCLHVIAGTALQLI